MVEGKKGQTDKWQRDHKKYRKGQRGRTGARTETGRALQKSKEPERAAERLRQRHRRECGEPGEDGTRSSRKAGGDEDGGQDQIGAKWGQGRQDQRRGRVGGGGRRQNRAWVGSNNQSRRRPGKQTKGTGRASFLSRSLFFLPFFVPSPVVFLLLSIPSSFCFFRLYWSFPLLFLLHSLPPSLFFSYRRVRFSDAVVRRAISPN